MKSIKSFWGQMHQKWFGPKIKDDKAKKTKNSRETTPTPAPTSASTAPTSSFGTTSNSDHLSARNKTKAPTTREEQINSNLEQMSGGLSRLKNLGITLQNELEAQDDLIDDVDAAIQRNN